MKPMQLERVFNLAEAQWEKAYPFFQKLEFKSLLTGVRQPLPATAVVTLPQKYTFVLVDTGEDVGGSM